MRSRFTLAGWLSIFSPSISHRHFTSPASPGKTHALGDRDRTDNTTRGLRRGYSCGPCGGGRRRSFSTGCVRLSAVLVPCHPMSSLVSSPSWGRSRRTRVSARWCRSGRRRTRTWAAPHGTQHLAAATGLLSRPRCTSRRLDSRQRWDGALAPAFAASSC